MKNLRKTKIICTLGPATDKDDVLRQLMLEGMNVARFNFSHGTHEEQGARLRRVCQLREELNLPIATLLDTKGPEIRLRDIEGGKAQLVEGQKFTLTTEEIIGNAERVSITYQDLVKDVAPGDRILIDDGLIELRVEEVTDTEIACHVQNGGMISNKKGVNVPNVELSMPYISEKDYEDIVFGIENDYDFVAASFVRTADDVLQIRKIFEEKDCHNINIIAKIENMQGVENIDEILKAADGIMKNPRPTRAEATDVANAIYDGTSAIMLSGETAAGMYPVEAVKTMVKLAIRTEQDINYTARFKARETMSNPDITNAISHATCTTANDLNAAAIITVTQSGKTARMISKYRPDCTIIGGSMHAKVCRQLNLSWGVVPLKVEPMEDADQLFEHAVDVAEKAGLVSMGDVTVITAGVPLGVPGTTNILKVQVAGHILVIGKGINEKSVSANLCVCTDEEALRKDFKEGDIIVAKDTSNGMMEQLREASGLIVEAGGPNAHAVIAGLSLDIPVLTEAKNATGILKTGAYVTLNGKEGIVSCN